MNTLRFVLWIAEIIAILAVLFALQIPLRKKKHPVIRVIVFILKVLLVPGMGLLFVAVESSFAYVRGDVLAAAYFAFFGDVLASIIEYIIRKIRKPGGKTAGKHVCRLALLGVLSLLFSMGFFAYGVFNAGDVRMKEHKWTAEGLQKTHTFAFAADLHASTSQSLDNLREFCIQVNAASPEFVILGGDITDELTSYENMAEAYSLLSKIEAPVYFIYGNHDRQMKAHYLGGRTYTDEQLEEALQGAGIRILSDEYIKLSDDLVLLGREDISLGEMRKPWTALKNPYEGSSALIVADHQPYDEEQLAIEDSALQVSGHTHAGQLWPLQLVYRLLGLPAYGEFKEPGTRLYVSAGGSGWMLPLRTEEHCEWELITLEPGAN